MRDERQPPHGREAAVVRNGPHSIAVDLALYNIEVIQSAVYRFARLGCVLKSVDSERNRAMVEFSIALSEQPHDALLVEFNQELTDQFLRQRIRAETEPVRNLILAHAFSDSDIAER